MKKTSKNAPNSKMSPAMAAYWAGSAGASTVADYEAGNVHTLGPGERLGPPEVVDFIEGGEIVKRELRPVLDENGNRIRWTEVL